jgi:hypothetical protein
VTFSRPQDWQSCFRCCNCWCPFCCNILLLLASHDNPAASAVATDTAVADIIAAVGVPWVPAVVLVSVVAGEPAAIVVFTAVAVPGAPGVVQVFDVSVVTTAVEIFPAFVVSNVSVSLLLSAPLLLLVTLLLMASLLWSTPSFALLFLLFLRSCCWHTLMFQLSLCPI